LFLTASAKLLAQVAFATITHWRKAKEKTGSDLFFRKLNGPEKNRSDPVFSTQAAFPKS
jgi:hypothetical protein